MDATAFEGARCLLDAADQSGPQEALLAVVRLVVIEAVCAETPGGAGDYVTTLIAANDPERGILLRVLNALAARDPFELAGALREAARICAARYAMQTARSLAELGYETAVGCGSWQDALRTARLLERLAELDECPRAAARWQRRALVHQRRVRKSRRMD